MILKLNDLHIDLSYTYKLNFKGHQDQVQSPLISKVSVFSCIVQS